MNRSSHRARRADDASHSVTTGFRADWTTQPGAFTLEGAFTAGQARALWPNLDPQTAAREPIATEPLRCAGRPSPWPLDAHARQRRVAADPVVRRRREPAGAGRELRPAHRSTSTRNTTRRSVRITIWWPVPATGSSARASTGHVGFSLTPADDNSSLVTAFLQDEIALFGNRLAVTLGTPGAVRLRLGRGRAADRARDVEGASPPAPLGGRLSRPADAVARPTAGFAWTIPPVPTASGLPLVVTLLGQPGGGDREPRRRGSRIPARDRDRRVD